MNRAIAPEFFVPKNITLPKSKIIEIGNGGNIHLLNDSHLEVFRLELIFRAGSYFGHEGQSFFTSKTMLGGTKKFSSEALINEFDNWGGFIDINQTMERLSIVLHGLTANFEKYLVPLESLLSECVFPETEFDLQKNIALQTFQVNNEKTAFIANCKFREVIYGENHFFGKTLNDKAIMACKAEDSISFYNAKIKNAKFEVFVSGFIGEKELSLLVNLLSNIQINYVETQDLVSPDLLPKSDLRIEKADSVQSSIRIGKRMFNRTHPDFFKFMLTNIYLGGYFGSKLMKNIREDKGLTYGISSSITPLADQGYFLISTDVKKENVEQAIEEIYKEINGIKTSKISNSELEVIQNYMVGSIIGSSNTVFEISDKRKAILFENLGDDFYENYVHNIHQINPDDIVEMANKYLNDLSLVVVG